MNRKKHLIFLVLITLGLVFGSCKKDKDEEVPTQNTTPVNGLTFTSAGSMTINMDHYFKDSVLKFSPDSFVTVAGDTINIGELKYYISNIRLTDTNGVVWNAGNYTLMNAQNAKPITITNIPAGTYRKISFFVGVDSTRNHTGAQDGDLDPAYGMAWTWNFGYIFFRINGIYSVEKKSYSLDIGGDQNLMNINLDMSSYQVSKNSVTMKMKMDANHLFEGPYIYDLKSNMNEIHGPTDADIPLLTTNIKAGMFSISSIQ